MSIRLAEANRAIQATLAKAHNLAVNISVTVCDGDGRLVAFQRMDGALAEANRASIGKALTSARSGRPSGDGLMRGSEAVRAAAGIGGGASGHWTARRSAHHSRGPGRGRTRCRWRY